MTSRTRNLSIIALVLVLLAALGGRDRRPSARCSAWTCAAAWSWSTRAGPTPQVPEVTPAAIDDAIETIRKRTDALGVSEPEIQRAGANQISIGLPDVSNADRAIEQVGTTAQLQFYDWEPNVLGDRGPDAPFAGSKALLPGGGAGLEVQAQGRADRRPAGRSPTAALTGASRPTARTTRRKRQATTSSAPTRS